MSDFSVYTAGEIVDWMSQGTVATPPSNLYLAVFDDTNTERSGDFANSRIETVAGTDWTVVGTDFENAAEESFGEAAADVNNLVDIALFDDTLANGGNEIARYSMANTPFDVASGTTLLFEAGEITFDVVDRTE